MKKSGKTGRIVFAILLFFALATELCLLADFILMFSAVYLPMKKFQLICVGILAVTALLVLLSRKAAKWLLLVLTVLICFSCIFLRWFFHPSQGEDFPEKMAFHEVDSGKEAVFAGKKVLLLVPHQDDDMNVFCGVMDEYLHYGSELTVAFMTNGDYFGLGEVRVREALDLYAYLGVPEENVVFLGYGDSLQTPDYHIYNAPADEVFASSVRKTETYCVEGHPPFREGHAYTRENLYADIRDLVLSVRPDVIFCTDFDTHPDHRACSMLFEQAMGEILRAEPDYTPAVYKGFAYSTAWAGEHDFFSVNIRGTKDIYHNNMLIQVPPLYRWEDRIRFPVRAGTLSRSLHDSGQYDELLFYSSQEEEKHAASVINGDKVFWQRSTDSLLRRASLTAGSGDPLLLNDFMLLDTRKISDLYHDPFDGVWSPDEGDEEKTVKVRLAAPPVVREVVLYVTCKRGQSAVVTIRMKDSGLTDSIFVRNPSFQDRLDVVLAQKLELIRMEDYGLLHLSRAAVRPFFDTETA